jgi:hypothetical protein
VPRPYTLLPKRQSKLAVRDPPAPELILRRVDPRVDDEISDRSSDAHLNISTRYVHNTLAHPGEIKLLHSLQLGS